MDSNLRIGILNGSDLTRAERGGGASGFISNILPGLPFTTTVFGIGYSDIRNWVDIPLCATASFVSIANFKNLPRWIPKRFPTLLLYLYSRRRILKSGVDILYIHSPECAWPFAILKSPLPVVFHQHGSANPVSIATFKWARNGLFRNTFEYMHRLIYKRCDWIIAIDRLCLEQALQNGAKKKVSLIMNAVDSSIFKPDPTSRRRTREMHGCSDDHLVLLFAGRLEEVKRVDRIIDSLLFLKDRLAVKLFVAGEGSLQKDLCRQASEKGLDDHVAFLGYVSHADLPALYNMADALMLPSVMEGTPMVILEALACGTPVIATRVGGIPDLVEDGGNGFLLDDPSPRNIASVVMQLAVKKFDRISVSRSVSRWSSEKVVQELTRIFTMCVNK